MSNRIATIALALLATVALAAPPRAGAQACFGDCNASGALTASDIGRINSTILRCSPCEGGVPGGVATGCATLANGCTAADFNGDGCIRASELGRANQNILRFPPNGCAPEATPTEGAVDTPTIAPSETPTEAVPTPTATPTSAPNTATPTQTPSGVCGDGLLSGAETCQSCPGDCAVGPCTVPSPAPTVAFRVNWAPPFGVDASSITVQVAYRSSLVSLPGSGSAPGARVTNRPSNSIVSINDLDYALRVVVTRSGAITPGRLFNVNFDRCASAAAPTPADFVCTVQGCASSFGEVAGCTCTVVTP